MSGSSETSTRKGPDLGRLSASEQQVLELLAQGHTAKSIAGLTGQSEGAINERLRSARRKTGVGSSRELARLIGAQKNRAENIGISAAMSPMAVDGTSAPPKRARLASLKGSLPMLVTLCAAAAAATLVFQGVLMNIQNAQSGAVDDPLVGSDIYQPPPNRHALHDQVRSEPRTPASARTEAALRDAYNRALQTGGKFELRVICGSTLCEAAGVYTGDHAQMNAAERAMQGHRMREDAEKAGLSGLGGTFGSPPHQHDAGAFVMYWKRQGD
ncbi:MAG TPA: helix-turn-helix transcriptional regulator [Caulobacteraceae bacterium]